MYKCDHCDYKSERIWCINRHIKSKHAPSQTGSGAEQSIQPHSQNEMQSNPQEENIDQLHENIEQYQRLQQEEKVTTSNDGRPSHVSIQLFDKCCKALKDYMYQCQGLRTEKELQLDGKKMT